MKEIKIGRLILRIGHDPLRKTKLSHNLIMYRKSFKIFNRWYKIDFPIGISK